MNVPIMCFDRGVNDFWTDTASQEWAADIDCPINIYTHTHKLF